jgi:hypothetical protein
MLALYSPLAPVAVYGEEKRRSAWLVIDAAPVDVVVLACKGDHCKAARMALDPLEELAREAIKCRPPPLARL